MISLYTDDHKRILDAIKLVSISDFEIYKFLMNCKHVIGFDRNVTSTCGTNGVDLIYYHKEFLDKISDSELLFVLFHESYHAILNHALRLQDRDSRLWNAACDYYINDKLIKDKIGTPLKTCLYDPKYASLSSDQIYKMLKNNPVCKTQNFDDHFNQSDLNTLSQNNSSIKDLSDNNSTKSKDSSEESGEDGSYSIDDLLFDLKNKTSKSKQSSFIKEITSTLSLPTIEDLSTEINWKKNLVITIKDYSKSIFSYNRLSKKSSGSIVFQKVQPDIAKVKAILAIDISGSISQSDLKFFLKEISSILKSKSFKSVHVYLFDDKLLSNREFKLNSNNSYTLIHDYIDSNLNLGGNGTIFECLDILKLKIHDYMIIFSDGYPCYSFGKKRKNLIYVFTSNVKAPHGKTIYFNKTL